MIKLDGLSEKEFGFIALEEHTNPLSAEIKNNIINIPGRIGARFVNSEIGVKRFVLNFGIKEQDTILIEQKINDFYRYLLDEKGKPREVKLTFDYEPNKYYMVKLDGQIDVNRIARYRSFGVYFIAIDPIGYGEPITIKVYPSTIYTNNGTYPSKGILTATMTANVSSLTVRLVTTGEYVAINDSLLINDVIVIDLEKQYVTRNGAGIMNKVYFESDFFDIPVGKFEISTSSGNLNLEYAERWL